MSNHRKPELPLTPYKTMWKNRLSVIDLHILHALYNGEATPTTLQAYLEKNGLRVPRTQLTARLRKLISDGVILKENTIIIDPTMLYDYIFLTLVKLHLPSLVAGYGRGAIDWRFGKQKIMELDKETHLIRMLFTIEGMGDYDMALIIYTNNLEEYYEFVSELSKEGIIEKVDGKRVHPPAGFVFDPVSLPDVENYKRTLLHFNGTLRKMVTELEAASSTKNEKRPKE